MLITLDLSYFMFVLVNALDEEKVLPGGDIVHAHLTTAYINGHQIHNNFCSTYYIVTVNSTSSLGTYCSSSEYYLRLSVALSDANHWTIPSSLYLYNDIKNKLGWKISFRDSLKIFDKDFVRFLDSFSSMDDMVNATFDIVDAVITRLKREIQQSPLGYTI